MANYLAVIQRAVASLDPNTVETRYALYDRARLMLRERLSQSTIEAEMASLDEAIELIEAETVRKGRLTPAAEPPRYEAPAFEPAPAEPPAEEIVEQSEDERARWRAVLLDAPKPKRRRVAIAAALVVFIGAAVFWFWPGGGGLEQAGTEERPVVNYVYLRQPVYYRTTHPVGTIIVDRVQNFLYFVRPNVVAIRYGIGVGRECATLTGLHRVTRKEEWPGLRWGSDDRAKNPLGARAIYFNEKHRIHGTNAPAQVIGDNVDHGCFHLANDDVIELYDKTPAETRVVVTE